MAFALLASMPVPFTFNPDKTSTREQTIHIDAPAGTTQISLVLQSFNFAYSDGRQYGFGQLGANLATSRDGSTWFATCVATLQDDKHDERKWQGQIVGWAQCWGNLD
jgi:hypothetical protein